MADKPQILPSTEMNTLFENSPGERQTLSLVGENPADSLKQIRSISSGDTCETRKSEPRDSATQGIIHGFTIVADAVAGGPALRLIRPGATEHGIASDKPVAEKAPTDSKLATPNQQQELRAYGGNRAADGYSAMEQRMIGELAKQYHARTDGSTPAQREEREKAEAVVDALFSRKVDNFQKVWSEAMKELPSSQLGALVSHINYAAYNSKADVRLSLDENTGDMYVYNSSGRNKDVLLFKNDGTIDTVQLEIREGDYKRQFKPVTNAGENAQQRASEFGEIVQNSLPQNRSTTPVFRRK